jgi:hypothetical protein
MDWTDFADPAEGRFAAILAGGEGETSTFVLARRAEGDPDLAFAGAGRFLPDAAAGF